MQTHVSKWQFFGAVGFRLPHVPCYASQPWFDLHPADKLQLPPAYAQAAGAFFEKNVARVYTRYEQILAENKVSISGFGVIMQATEDEWKQLFDFAKSLGIRWISSEPPADMLPAIAKMAKESGVRVAIHNHPVPSRYYDPIALLKTIEPYGPEIGLCADTGKTGEDTTED